MYRASVDSRFPDYGKVILLSFPRFKNDYIQQRYDNIISEKEIISRSHKFKLDPELPDNTVGNEFEIFWDEDQIISYKYPRVYAIRRPTWEVNPTRSIEDFKIAFYRDVTDALGRFACMPPEAIDAFFKSREKIEMAFNDLSLAVDGFGRFEEWFNPKDDTEYFIHVDLAQKHDHCAVSMAHIEKFVSVKVTDTYSQPAPIVKVDAVMYWTPTSDKSVDFGEVRDYILSLRSRGFNIRICTFDRWNSHDMMQQLKQYGINTETLSVAKKHYDDMAMVVLEERLNGPHIPLLVDELLELRIMRDKVDHPRKGSKDLADAVCGSIYNAISLTRAAFGDIEVHDYSSVKKQYRESIAADAPNLIRAPSQMPRDLYDALSGMEIV
jgi:hypothetical protein